MLASQKVSVVTRRVRETLKSGAAVAVVGWRASNHNDFTRGLSDKKVVFFDQYPHSIGLRVGLAVFTPFIDHSMVAHIARKTPVFNDTFKPHVLRGVLESCKDLLTEPERPEPAKETEAIDVPTPTEPKEDLAVLDFLTSPSRRSEMTAMHKFAEAFQAEAEKNNGSVGKIHLGKLIRELDLPSATKLCAQGWLMPVISDGCKKAGSYRAMGKLIELLSAPCREPENPYQRAMFIIEQEPALVAERKALLGQLLSVRKKLQRVGIAKKVIEQLKALESV